MAGNLEVSPGINITPAPSQVTLSSNYITNFDFLSQYLPDIMEQEFERYGNRSIAAMLRQVGAELPSASDLIKWTEQGRLHTKYTDCSIAYGGGNDTAVLTVDGGTCNFRVGQTVFLSHNASTAADKAVITARAANDTFTVAYYAAAGGTIPDTGNDDITAFVYGSEFRKGVNGMEGALEAESEIFEVNPIIIKDKYEVSGSDMAQIGWVEVEGDNGTGYLWYIKSNHETRLRFEDYLEMSMVEAVPAETNSGVAALTATTDVGNKGTEGMLYSIEDRGNVWSGGIPDSLGDFDDIIKRLDGQGAIQENMLFVNRDMDLDLNDMLAAQNSYGVGGTSYGMFNNSEQMALNLGFSGFKRGYEFYKTDWKYLNDATLRGNLVGGSVNGVLVPAGTTTVYDNVLGKNAKRPFLHVRYRKSETEDRRYKTWITGSAGGAQTSDLDAMEVHYLTERAICTLGANNFFIFK